MGLKSKEANFISTYAITKTALKMSRKSSKIVYSLAMILIISELA